MPERVIVGFGHRRRRGKDLCCEIAQRILNMWGMPARIDGFAGSLKAMCREVFGLNESQLYGQMKFEVDPFWGLTPRRILQLAGTEAMRHTFGDDIWVRTLTRRVHMDSETSVLICDVRFPSEVAGIRELGGLVVKVDRPVDQVPPGGAEEDLHPSETALADYTGWDAVIENNGSLGDLTEKVRAVLTRALAHDSRR